MARYVDPMRDLGTVKSETADEARRRRKREYEAEVEDRAIYLVQNDPELAGDMRAARKAAREQIALENDHLNPDAPKSSARSRSKDGKPTSSRPSRKKSSRTGDRAARSVRSTARTVAAPFGSTASAGWTFFQGGLSLVLLYVVLRDADAVSAFARGIGAGIRRLGDPRTPLIPSNGEAVRSPRLRVIKGGGRPVTLGKGPYANKPLAR